MLCFIIIYSNNATWFFASHFFNPPNIVVFFLYIYTCIKKIQLYLVDDICIKKIPLYLVDSATSVYYYIRWVRGIGWLAGHYITSLNAVGHNKVTWPNIVVYNARMQMDASGEQVLSFPFYLFIIYFFSAMYTNVK